MTSPPRVLLFALLSLLIGLTVPQPAAATVSASHSAWTTQAAIADVAVSQSAYDVEEESTETVARGFRLRFTDFFVFLVAILAALLIGYIGAEIGRLYKGSLGLMVVAIAPVIGSIILVLWLVLDFVPNRYPQPRLAEYDQKQVASEVLSLIAPKAIEKISEIERLNKQSEELEVRSQTLTDEMKEKRSDIVELASLARDVEASVASTRESLRQLTVETDATKESVLKIRSSSPSLSVVIEQQFATTAAIEQLKSRLVELERDEAPSASSAAKTRESDQESFPDWLIALASAFGGALVVWFFTPRPRPAQPVAVEG